jgi:hypothetical protein
MRTLKYITVLLLALILTPVIAAEVKLSPPAKPFSSYPQPPAPDYAKPETWAVWPGKASPADQIPPGAEGKAAADPKADVFFIHPTTFLDNATWNAKYDDSGFAGRQLDDLVLRYQVSVFNSCCRMYVPRYRQATLSAFVNPGEDANKAFDLAYSDVVRAFDYYITHENKGRPFILASHSQGSLHATRLVQERIANNPEIRKRLVVAYVVGASLPDSIDFTGLPVCDNAKETGCLIDWNSASGITVLSLGRRMMVTYGKGNYRLVGNDTWLCVNPLSWDRKTAVPRAANLGSLPIADEGKPLAALQKGVTGAKCERGRLVVGIPYPRRKHFRDIMTTFGSYHNQDYSLFYASLRQNAIDRVAAFSK